MGDGARDRSAGFTLGELLVVTAVALTAAAVAVPVVWRATRLSQLEAARCELASRLRLASERAATTGRTESFALFEQPLPFDAVSSPRGVEPPAGTVACTAFELQGGTGYPLVSGERAAVAVVLTERGADEPWALVVGRSGTLTRHRLVGERWEEEP